jgi:hypothetical protein
MRIDKMNEYELATEAQEDRRCLADVFAWTNEIFASIEDCSSDQKMIAGAALLRISRLAALGRNLSTNWQVTAESMSDKFEKELKDCESGLDITARAFATGSCASNARESEHA